jgi:hypothetical protein
MSDHIRRGVTLHQDVPVPGEPLEHKRPVMGDYHCRLCDSLVRLRAREDEHHHVRLGCECGAVELALRLATEVDGHLDTNGIVVWERRRQSEVFNDDY